ncbi:MAG: ATP-binding cassette domain-containing protein [Brevibacterium sp.]|uniref:ATP-binding cassette domain-containing protein n=1 Tax=Brevibacterium sp. TaxID=1701 RepID=UPI002647E1BE|nr:ATP-binding cassette domain-containing protein [Brevibacterium sp.]MDN5806809.1 ATP-binding cassette domain-containing protein [Brevibacterium sp.]MDN5833105.1 ATP-binding cassette domain-containing protein [Brevibacterium sp.]MDN5876574.1 ATP-binding cassette domain-containing protein [Brevibacterium sp.]MDN5909153.1 ATP-binding cassette domain-containing protein [Brevibacterium sp.]MDN6133848.1 ATP-binding cassette domain-containing protein [Brevibacterium sp.]
MTQPTQTHQDSTFQAGVDIELQGVSKRYSSKGEAAVADLNVSIPAGEMVMFVGPSGCGKTTSLKMINRLIEPTNGRILIDGEDVTDLNPTKLRRKIGYVIQGGGMIPHLSVGDNVGLVPKLLNWDKKRIRERVDSLMDLVGLDPVHFRDRYPRELSGGQQQRVGVARGLAADPPIVLMDEPFGAVDPITRSRLQDELMRIQSELKKTIVCVTHDIDEAIKLGDRILILERGATIAQYDTPESILAAPANEFVEDFIGSGSTLKQLSLRRVDELDLTQPPIAHIGDRVAEVEERARAAGEASVIVLDSKERPREWLSLRQLRHADEVPTPTIDLQTVIDHRSTLNDALDAMLASSHGGAMVTNRGRYIGVLSYAAVTDYVRALNEQSSDEAESSAPRTSEAARTSQLTQESSGRDSGAGA